MSNLPDQLQPGALCTLLDVTKRVPGYSPGDDAQIDEILGDLVVQESQDFLEVTGREIIPANNDTTRTFDLTASILRRRQLPIGDAAAVTAVELFDYDTTTSLGVIDAGLYLLTPRLRQAWEPYRRIAFPQRPNTMSVRLAPGRTIRLTGTWGFPAIPATVTRAVATLTLFRYLNEVASAGTKLADIVNRENFNLASALRAAFDVRERLSGPPFA